MSSTNKTTYYDLPQFVDNDIFNPLVDDNDAYSKIDTALHNIAEAEASHASDIVSVKGRLDAVEGDIDVIKAQNGDSVLTTSAQTLSGAVNELDTDISGLNGRLNNVENDINNASTGLKVKVAALEEKTKTIAIYLGNSYAAGNPTAGYTGIFDRTKDMFDEAYLYEAGGAGFLPYTNHSTTFLTMLQTAINDTRFNNNDVTDIIILSAWGDTQSYKYDSANYSANMQTALTDLRTMVDNNFNSKVRVSLSFVEARKTREIAGTTEGVSYYNEPFIAHNFFHTYANIKGIEYLGWLSWDIFLMNGYYAADDYHPNNAGFLAIATAFKQAYKGNYDYTTKWGNITGDSEITTGSKVTMFIGLTPNYATVSFNRVNLAAGDTVAQYAACDLCKMYNASNPQEIAIPNTKGMTIAIGNIHLDANDLTGVSYRGDIAPDGTTGFLKLVGTLFDTAQTYGARQYASLDKTITIYFN